MASEATCDVGLYGLAVMGQNFALNMASKVLKFEKYKRLF